MKFLVDAQLPRWLATYLIDSGHDAVHTTQLPEGNRTSDSYIARLADQEERVVVTKDSDFWKSHILGHSPKSLLLVGTGNIANSALSALFDHNLDAIVEALSESDVVELRRDRLIAHVDKPGGE